MERSRSFDNRDRQTNPDRTRFLRENRSQSVPPERNRLASDHINAHDASDVIREFNTLRRERLQVANALLQFEQNIRSTVQRNEQLSPQQLEIYNHLLQDLRRYDDNTDALFDANYIDHLSNAQLGQMHEEAHIVEDVRSQLETKVATSEYQAVHREVEDLTQLINDVARLAADHVQLDIQQGRPPNQDLLDRYQDLVDSYQTYRTHLHTFEEFRHEDHLTDNQRQQMQDDVSEIEDSHDFIQGVAQMLERYHNRQRGENENRPQKKRRLE